MTEKASALGKELGFDPKKLKEKYLAERDKRLRVEGNDQYTSIRGEFSYFETDPYVTNQVDRDPLHDEVDVLIIGGGFGGLLAGAKLRDAGLKRIRVIEKGGDFGGTWYWNRYPGAQCDIESYIYFPLLEELGYVPTEKYAYAPEILAHAQAIGRKYDLYEHACFQTEVSTAKWDEKNCQWIVTTDRGDNLRTRFLVATNGILSQPKLPAIPGIENYKGHTFHTSRWDYGYTGGGSDGNLENLADKRVAIVGTGATAIQCVPHLAASAEHLYVLQRTPSSVDVRNNKPTDPSWAENLHPNWHSERMSNFNILVAGGEQEEDLVNDGWTAIMRNLALIQARAPEANATKGMEEAMELADYQKMEEIRNRVDSIVENPEVAERLKPYYRMFCKRPCFNDDYLPSFNRPNVTLIDTDGRGVERITEKGFMHEGVEYEVDCLIFATGFEVGTSYISRTGYELIGTSNRYLSEKWANGPSTFHGLHSHQFPNCFFVGPTQTGLTPNVPHGLREQASHIAYILDHCLKTGAKRIEATQDAEEQWCETMKRLSSINIKFVTECTPGYYNGEGDPEAPSGLRAASYGEGSEAFFKVLQQWREDGELAGLVLS